MLQSPVNGSETPDPSIPSANINNIPAMEAAEETTASCHPLSDPLQALSSPGLSEAQSAKTPDSGVQDITHSSSSPPSQASKPEDLLEPKNTPDLIDSLTSNITNLPPVPRSMYNISSMDSMGPVSLQDGSPDLFESCVEDAVIRPFSNVSLQDADAQPHSMIGAQHQVELPPVFCYPVAFLLA